MTGRPGLRTGVRLVHDQARARHALLYPEGVLLLNDTAAAVVERCDTRRTATEITADLRRSYDGVDEQDVVGLLRDLTDKRLLAAGSRSRPAVAELARAAACERPYPVPLGLAAEVTYRCPLRCPYCSNPVNLRDFRDELTTAEWFRVLDQARDLGVLQVHLSGGEPLARRDLAEFVRHIRGLGMYASLVTSGIGLTGPALEALVDAGVDHVQLSIQDAEAAPADRIAGIRAHQRKLAAAELVKRHDLPFTVNAVLHRGNIDRIEPIADLASRMGAERLELANTQYYGWARANRTALLPTREQLAAAEAQVRRAQATHGKTMEIVYVAADYYETRPKPCMYGWGVRQLIVAPNGDVLPCTAAAQLPDLRMPNVRERELAEIWYDSAAFTRFRGTDWMPEPCHSCALREIDFGGCRCQAYELTGDPAAADPVCDLASGRAAVEYLVTQTEAEAGEPAYLPRLMGQNR